MTKVTILTTENLIEGTTGAIAMIVTANIIKYLFDPHLLIIGGISFFIGWIARKIIINITNHWYYKLPNEDIVIDI
jgi:predicted tellurium resistance membrane protein TerC